MTPDTPLDPGASGSCIAQLQQLLSVQGWQTPATGVFDLATAQALASCIANLQSSPSQAVRTAIAGYSSDSTACETVAMLTTAIAAQAIAAPVTPPAMAVRFSATETLTMGPREAAAAARRFGLRPSDWESWRNRLIVAGSIAGIAALVLALMDHSRPRA